MIAPRADSTVTVMSYNILCGGEDRLDHIVEVVRGVKPDALALVEAGDEGGVRWLGEQLEMDYRVFPSRAPYSVAVLSPHSIRTAIPPNAPASRQSRFAPVFVNFPGCGERLLVATHLSSRLAYPWGGLEARLREVRALLAQLAPYRDLPHLLVGDFNAAPHGDGMAVRRPRDTGQRFATGLRQGLRKVQQKPGKRNLKRFVFNSLFESLQHLIARPGLWPLSRPLVAGLNPWQVVDQIANAGYVDCFAIAAKEQSARSARARHTWPSWSAAAKIDHIFATPSVAPDVVDCWVVDTPPAADASDHLPVAVRLRWCPAV